MNNQYLMLFSFAKVYVKFQFRTFSSEDIKTAFFKRHPGIVFNHCHFGSVMTQLAEMKLIKETGSTKSKTPSSKSARILTYISLEYSRIQQANRKLAMPEIQFK